MDSAVLVANTAIIPAICMIGIIANVINLIVLIQPEMKRSQYVYLAVMSFVDIITLSLEMASGIGQGYFQGGRAWAFFDAYIHLPLGCVTTSISVAAMTIYTIERYIYARRPIASRTWCQRPVAKKAVTVVIIISAIFNIPYFFAFEVDDNDEMVYTTFATSCYYEFHNWFRLCIYGVLSFGIMLFVNGCIISTLYRAHRFRQVLFTKTYISQDYRLRNRIRVMRVVIAAVTLFALGELPTHFISRTSVYDFIFKWLDGYDRSNGFEQSGYKLIRAVATILMCSQYAAQFMFYIPFDILYCKVFKQIFCRKRQCCNCCAGDQTDGLTPIRTISAPS